MGTLFQSAAIDAAKAQFAVDFPAHELWPGTGQAIIETDRVVVLLSFKPNGKPLLPAPQRVYAVSLDCASCKQLHGNDSARYQQSGPRK